MTKSESESMFKHLKDNNISIKLLVPSPSKPSYVPGHDTSFLAPMEGVYDKIDQNEMIAPSKISPNTLLTLMWHIFLKVHPHRQLTLIPTIL